MPNKNTLLKYLRCAELARENENVIRQVFPLSIFLEDEDTDTQGYCALDGDNLIVGFRGTQQLKDWLTDINAFHVEYPYNNYNSKIMVHRGFIQAYKSVRALVHEFYTLYKDKIKVINVCGHSLGGSLATLCAIDLQYNFDKPVNAYVSGNPMVGNSAFRDSYNKRVPNTYRTYLKRDLVPLMPPQWFEKIVYGGYVHCGIANPIGPGNILTGIINWIKRRFKSENVLADLTNHSIILYKQYII